MKNILSLFTIIVMITACSPAVPPNGKVESLVEPEAKEISHSESNLQPANLLTLIDAQKIMGETLKLEDSASTITGTASVFNCGYTGITEDKKTGKVGKLYLAYWQYNDIPTAHKAYTDIKVANEKNGIEVVQDLGDEAYYHSDKQNFYFIMVRKGKNVFDMKVNKITSTTSLEEFRSVAKKITSAL